MIYSFTPPYLTFESTRQNPLITSQTNSTTAPSCKERGQWWAMGSDGTVQSVSDSSGRNRLPVVHLQLAGPWMRCRRLATPLSRIESGSNRPERANFRERARLCKWQCLIGSIRHPSHVWLNSSWWLKDHLLCQFADDALSQTYFPVRSLSRLSVLSTDH